MDVLSRSEQKHPLLPKGTQMLQREPIELLPEDIKGALDHLDDAEFLTSSKLGGLQCISLQMEKGATVSVDRRGWLVRELLQKAFAQMKPGDVRSDTALEWRLYNILWYHYFKYNLPNHNTAARLSIGLREFYRERDRAIEELRREVLAIERSSFPLGE